MSSHRPLPALLPVTPLRAPPLPTPGLFAPTLRARALLTRALLTRALLTLTLLALTLLGPAAAPAATIHVPLDQPTIKSGLQAAAPGDTVLVACGTYTQSLIEIPSGVVLRSESGDPSCATIDGNGVASVLFGIDLDDATAIEGFTVTGGLTDDHGGAIFFRDAFLTIRDCVFQGNEAEDWGGALAFFGTSSPRIERCRFEDNEGNFGGAIYCAAGTATIEGCRFVSNRAQESGGALYAFGLGASPTIENSVFHANEALIVSGGAIVSNLAAVTVTGCTFVANSARIRGAAVYSQQGGSVELERCVLAFNRRRESVACAGGATATLVCCDDFKNDGGDWLGCLASQRDIQGNFSADPLFCDRAGGDLALQSGSPCAPRGACGLVGALGVGCGPVSLESITWGELKASYRR